MRMNRIPFFYFAPCWALATVSTFATICSLLPLVALANPTDDKWLQEYRSRPSHKALGAYSNGVRLMNQERFPEAIKELEQAVKIDPTCYGALSALGYIYGFIEKFDKSLEYQTKAVQVAPKNDAAVYYRRAFTLLALFKHDQALKDMDRVVALEPKRYDVLRLRAKTHLALKRPDLALKDYDSAIKIEPQPEETIYKRAELLTSLGKYDKALADYQFLAKHFPKDVDAFTGLAEVHRLTGKFQLAIDELTKALSLQPENPGYCYSTRAFCYEKLGKTELANKDKAEAKKYGITKPGRATEFSNL